MATEEPEEVEAEAPAPVLPGMLAEVAGEERSLQACIDDGPIEKPRLLQWNGWQAWRKREGRRPVYTWERTPEGIAAQKAFVQREVRLWKELMKHLYGDDWRDQLDARVGDEDPPGDALAVALGEAPGIVGGPPAPPPDDSGSLGALSAGSWAALGIEDLRALALADFDPAMEALPDYESRVYRSVALLEARGAPVAEDDLQGRILRARFIMETAGQEPQEAVRTLRSSLARVLEEDDGSLLHALRAEAIVSLLSERSGGAPGGILGRLLNPSSRSASMRDASQSDAPPPGLGRPAEARSGDTSGAFAVGSARIATDPGLANRLVGGGGGRPVDGGTPIVPAGADAVSQAILELLRERRGPAQNAGPAAGAEPRSTI